MSSIRREPRRAGAHEYHFTTARVTLEMLEDWDFVASHDGGVICGREDAPVHWLPFEDWVWLAQRSKIRPRERTLDVF
jgi:hypothetical protein